MKKFYWFITGISIPVALYGIFVLVIAFNVYQINEASDRWMVELEPDLNLNEGNLLYQMRSDDVGQHLQFHKIRYLDEYVENFPLAIHAKLKDADLLDDRYVLYIDKKSGYSDDDIREMLIQVEGVRNAEIATAWILGKR